MKENGLKSFYSTMIAPCPYVAGRGESKLAVDISGACSQSWNNVLSRAGFRRSHGVCYIPACPDCDECVSVRIPVADFLPSKKMRKVLRLNQDATVAFTPNIATTEQYALFSDYLESRHAKSDMTEMYFEEFRAMIEDSCVDSAMMEVRENAVLQAAMLVDVLDDGLSAVYSFFNPEQGRRSRGTFMILKLIEEARKIGLPYVYLGYWIKSVSNMAYKAKFQPLEYFVDGKWTRSFPD